MTNRTDTVYFDHNATTPLHPEALACMLPYLQESFGNPSSTHGYGQQARRAIDDARRQVGRCLGVSEGEVFFVSGGTESNNLALAGTVAACPTGQVPHLVTSAIEHPAVLATCARLRDQGAEVSYVGVDRGGRVDPTAVAAALRPNTVLVSLMLANNDVGTLQPVREVGQITRARGVLLHTDAVQALGKVAIDVPSLGADLVSISAHKIGGPKGAGALVVRRGVRLAPQICGGGQERGRRGGTENVAAIVGFGRACELAFERSAEDEARIEQLRDRLQRRICERVSAVRVNGDRSARLPNTLSVAFEGVEAAALVMNLDLAGIACSVGSACASGKVEPSHVLQAMALPPPLARATVRFSLGPSNTAAQVDRVVESLAPLVSRLRAFDAGDEASRLGRTKVGE